MDWTGAVSWATRAAADSLLNRHRRRFYSSRRPSTGRDESASSGRMLTSQLQQPDRPTDRRRRRWSSQEIRCILTELRAKQDVMTLRRPARAPGLSVCQRDDVAPPCSPCAARASHPARPAARRSR